MHRYMSNATRLLLLRHGQDQDNAAGLINGRRDTPLTELGRLQAETAADGLRDLAVDCVYSSPLKRAHETACIISKQLKLDPPVIHPDLVERDYGILTGRPPSEIPAIAGEFFESHNFKHIIESPGMESYDTLWRRAGKVIRHILERHAGETVLVVAHNEILKMLRASFNGRSWRDELLLAPISNCQVIVLDGQGEPPACQPDHVDGE